MENKTANRWLGVNPGLLRHRVDVQERTDHNDSFGTPIPSWSAIGIGIKANVEPLIGRELFQARQLYAEVTHRITLRYLDEITAKHRIMMGARVFDILSVLNIEERNLLIEIMAKEIV